MCVMCKKTATTVQKKVVGTFLRITQFCKICNYTHTWDSQPYIGNIPAGNLLTSAAILYTGSFPSKAIRIFKTLNCATISLSTFFRHQSSYLQPTINSVWIRHQQKLLSTFKSNNAKLQVGGDGRADSPGHCAKYGAYSLIELTCNRVIDFQLVQVCVVAINACGCSYETLIKQSNECGGSYHMEKEGLVRTLNFLKQQGLSVEVLVTDRHRQIAKYLKTTHPEIEHYYDVWHLAKSKL